MLEKSIFFSRVPKYLFDKDKTPYFTKPKNMSILQSQYELFSYGVFVGTIALFIGTAALVTYLKNYENTYVFLTILNLAIIGSIHLTIKKSISFCSYIMAFAPLILFAKLMYDTFLTTGSFVKIVLLATLMMIFVKYGIRLIKIVYYQNKKNKLEE